ncbi:helix-turn-helix domain-containing protein [Brumimicrobium sp.]|uniref:helix-turn-helix domain-containing protein n=1 Tax=Brumimicrobium sp. TaxID=2029867 RepID=UPI003A8FC694
MQVITIESEAFQKLVNQLEAIQQKLNQQKETTPLSDVWMDNQDVCALLHVSKRTLQHYRDSGKLPFSQIGAKIYYKASDVDDFLESNYKKKVG